MSVNGKRPAGHVDAVHEAERAVEDIEGSQERLRARARRIIGIRGDDKIPSFREEAERSGSGWYPLLAVGVLGAVGELQAVVLAALGPEISRSLGIGKSAVTFIVLLRTMAVMAVSLPAARYVQNRVKRQDLAVGAAVVWGLVAIASSVVLTTGTLLVLVLLAGAASGAALAAHTPLLTDAYPTGARLRALAWYRSAVAVGTLLAPIVVAIGAFVLDLTWRGVFVLTGIVCFSGVAAALRLRDPGFGRWDAEPVRDEVWRDAGATVGDDDRDRPLDLGFGEAVRRVMAVPTVRRLLIANALIGMMLFPLQSYLFFFLEERRDVAATGRTGFSIAVFAVTAVVLVVLAPVGERLHRQDPARLVGASAWLLAAVVPFLLLAVVSPVIVVTLVGFAGVFAAIAATNPALTAVLFGVVPSRLRPYTAALSGIFLAGVGGIGGVLLLDGIDRRFGIAGAIVSLGGPAVVGALVLRGAAAGVGDDVDRVIDEIVEREEIAIIQRQGRHLPMLSCRHIDFSYGQLQVLFDVSFTVDDGEMVALLGTNGAGKSTLLRVISGLGLPSRGSVTFRGSDITFLDAERRLDLGITQIPGGKATFPPLTVVENLRIFGHSLGRKGRGVDEGIDATFGAFPRLGERRNQLASTLSGGEQQMLALGKAFILKPRLLLIDELSLGLAPKVVGELLEMVRRINADGTAVVLVEQSVNIALSLVDHAYFMEKGEMRFDGPAPELLERRDLLRSVFLEGATKGLQ